MRPTTDSNLHLEAIRRMLDHLAGDAPDAGAIAEATLNIWRQIALRLSPIIGARGVDVLMGRALHLTTNVFPWLAGSVHPAGSATLLAEVKTRLAGSQSNIAVEASCAFLTNFVELLTTLIGKSLTELLLNPVWGLPSAPSKKEKLS
ncbi:MAG: hypothetical protein R6W75_04965 [Smithellaceae bacterium]